MRAARVVSQAVLSALLCFTVAAAQGATPQADLDRAEESLRNGDLPTALGLIQGAAESGYAPAQARLGEILDKAEDDKQAVAWYRKAAEQGNAAGMFGLGVEYLTGEGIKKDLQQAYVWILRAAEKDYLMAMDTLAGAYRNGGLGQEIDFNKANYWAAKADALRPPPPPKPPETKGRRGR